MENAIMPHASRPGLLNLGHYSIASGLDLSNSTVPSLLITSMLSNNYPSLRHDGVTMEYAADPRLSEPSAWISSSNLVSISIFDILG